jgi:kinesin family protein C1
VRAKPINDGEVSILSFGSDGQHLTVTDEQTRAFVFDKVLPMAATQNSVYAELSGLVQSAVDGNKVSLFAYGQTSSGKTHTVRTLFSRYLLRY